MQCLPLPVGEDATLMELTPDGSRLLTVTNREQLLVWDTSSWHKVASYKMDTEVSVFFSYSKFYSNVFKMIVHYHI